MGRRNLVPSLLDMRRRKSRVRTRDRRCFTKPRRHRKIFPSVDDSARPFPTITASVTTTYKRRRRQGPEGIARSTSFLPIEPSERLLHIRDRDRGILLAPGSHPILVFYGPGQRNAR